MQIPYMSQTDAFLGIRPLPTEPICEMKTCLHRSKTKNPQKAYELLIWPKLNV